MKHFLLLLALILSSCTTYNIAIIMQQKDTPPIKQSKSYRDSLDGEILDATKLFNLDHKLDSLVIDAAKKFPPLEINLDSIFNDAHNR